MGKILLITDFFRPEPGGLELLFTGIARGFAPDQIEVIVSAAEDQYIVDRRLRASFDLKEPYSLRRIPVSRNVLFRENTKSFELFVATRLRSRTYSHVLIGNLSRATRIATGIALSAGVPYSFFINGSDLRKLRGFRARAKYKKILYHAANLFALSRQIGHMLHFQGGDSNQIHVVPPGMETRFAGIKGTLPELLKSQINGRYLITAVGPLLPRKGFEHLVRMFDYLQDLKGRICVMIAGSGPELAYLRELIRSRGLENTVFLTGFLTDEVLVSLYQNTKIVVQPGQEREDDAEGISVALMEAAWFGIPSIAGAIGGVNDIVKDGKTGIIVKAGNSFELADRIRFLFTNENERLKLAKNAKASGKKDFSMEKIHRLVHSQIEKTNVQFY